MEPRRRTLKHLRIFLSNAAGDQPFADALACAIQRGGADVQIVAHSEDSEKGEYTGAPTEEILRDVWVRPIFVVILSTEALASTWIRYECQWAIRCYRRDAGRIILPVVARPIDHLDEGAIGALGALRHFLWIEAPGFHAYPQTEAIERTLCILALLPTATSPSGDVAQAQITPDAHASALELLTQGIALINTGQFAPALPFLERAIQLAPRSQDGIAWGTLGWVYSVLRRPEEAVEAYQRALARSPDIVWVWHYMAITLRMLARLDEALEAAKQATTLDPDASGAWLSKGAILRELQRPEEALEACERAVALDPNLAAAWNGKGSALAKLQRREEALAAYDRAVELDPNSSLAWGNRGSTQFSLKQYEAALDSYDHALSLEGSAPRWNNKGSALLALKRYEEALSCYDHALALDPHLAIAVTNRARTLRALRRVHFDRIHLGPIRLG